MDHILALSFFLLSLAFLSPSLIASLTSIHINHNNYQPSSCPYLPTIISFSISSQSLSVSLADRVWPYLSGLLHIPVTTLMAAISLRQTLRWSLIWKKKYRSDQLFRQLESMQIVTAKSDWTLASFFLISAIKIEAIWKRLLSSFH